MLLSEPRTNRDNYTPLNQTRYVLIDRFAELVGYTRRAIEAKIAEGKWREGFEFRRAPDGRILVDLRGFEKWVEKREIPQ